MRDGRAFKKNDQQARGNRFIKKYLKDNPLSGVMIECKPYGCILDKRNCDLRKMLVEKHPVYLSQRTHSFEKCIDCNDSNVVNYEKPGASQGDLC